MRLPLLLFWLFNRSPDTFETSLDTTYRLLARIPDGVQVVTESGFSARDQIVEMRRNGVDTFLIGETFMRAADPGAVAATGAARGGDPRAAGGRSGGGLGGGPRGSGGARGYRRLPSLRQGFGARREILPSLRQVAQRSAQEEKAEAEPCPRGGGRGGRTHSGRPYGPPA